ncbi:MULTISPECIES: GNAT family N-acetyltransferase [unclassified Streptomyces]|uniref:GNAT family N-acetyltransferase n=1 Tax=unclassified Streptomyces TaxID=2593676 RepID=UPI0027E3F6BC|nr:MULTISPECIES: GNAT family N-acetyltransferase [unclassified Streptomyces]
MVAPARHIRTAADYRGRAGAGRARTPTSWIHATWGGPCGLAASGAAWDAFRRGRLLALACTYVLGSRYKDVAALADSGHRLRHPALACVTALCEDIPARGRVPSWSCSRADRPSRLLAWRAGFRLHREYVHYATGGVRPTARG